MEKYHAAVKLEQIWGVRPLYTGTATSTQFELKERSMYLKCEWLTARTEEVHPNAVCQQLFTENSSLSISLNQKYLNGLQKICELISVLRYEIRADDPNSPPEICLHSHHYDHLVWPLMCCGSGISLQKFSSTNPAPSDLHIDASDSPRLTHGDSWCLEQNNPDLPTPTPLLWCRICCPSYRAEL